MSLIASANIPNPQKSRYFNARIVTVGAPDATNPKYEALYEAQLPGPLISDPQNYNMSIVRFSTTLHGLPALFVDHPVQAGANPTNTNYVFSLSYGPSVVSQVVQWSPADPDLRQTLGNYNDQYWYLYNYIYFSTFINDALATAMAALIVLQPGLSAIPPPFFQYNSTSATWTLWTPVEFKESAGTPIHLYANEPAHFLMQGLPTAPTGIPGQDEQFLILQQPAEPKVTLDGHDYVLREQLPGSLCTWSPVRRFVITTARMDIIPETTTPSIAFTVDSSVPQNSVSTQRVITDFTPTLSRGDELINGSIEYTPTAQYRYTNLGGSAPISAVDFGIYWETPLGDLILHKLSFGGYGSLKMLFQAK